MTLAALITCHNSSPLPAINCLNGQSRPPDEILVCCSPPGSTPTHSTDPRIHWTEQADAEDFGYAKRQLLANHADSDYLMFFSHDDSYHPRYIELMMQAAKDGAQVVWCPWSDRPKCDFKACDSTLGNFIIRRKLFLDMGGFELPPDDPPSRKLGDLMCHVKGNHGFRDAWLIQRLIDKKVWPIIKVPYLMYYHNTPYGEGVTPQNWGQDCIAGSYTDWLRFTNYQMNKEV